MNETEQKLLERAIKAETEVKFLYKALSKIVELAPFDNCYHIACAACNGYEQSQN